MGDTMSETYIVYCECGFRKEYDDHPAANAGQAGHAKGCSGPRTMIFTDEVPEWATE